MNNTDQQEPTNKEFDCCNDHTSSDSSNDGESAVEEDVLDGCEDNNPPEEESNQSINYTHRENQWSIQCINALQPPKILFGGRNWIIEHYEKTQGSTQHIQRKK